MQPGLVPPPAVVRPCGRVHSSFCGRSFCFCIHISSSQPCATFLAGAVQQQQQSYSILQQQQYQQSQQQQQSMTSASPLLAACSQIPTLRHASTIPLHLDGDTVRDAAGNVLLNKLNHKLVTSNLRESQHGALVLGASSEHGPACCWDVIVGSVSGSSLRLRSPTLGRASLQLVQSVLQLCDKMLSIFSSSSTIQSMFVHQWNY